jgi:hypothetical protein
MRWLFVFLLLVAPVQAADTGLMLAGVSNAPAASGYTGPGDVVSGATAWYGLRAYNAAYATGSNNAINVRRASDNSTSNIVILSSGAVDVATYNTFVGTDATASCTLATTALTCTGASATLHVNDPITGVGITNPCVVTATNGSTTATVSIAGTSTSCGTVAVAETVTFQVAGFLSETYDQTGNGNNLTQGTAANQPQLLPLCLNNATLPCIFTIRASSQKLQGGVSGGVAPPWSVSVVGGRYGTTNAVSEIFSPQIGAPTLLGWTSTANQLRFYAGSTLNATANDLALHAFNGENTSGTGIINIDGTETSGSIGSGQVLGSNAIEWFGGNPITSYSGEAGIWTAAFSGTQRTNECHNQYLYWATATSC